MPARGIGQALRAIVLLAVAGLVVAVFARLIAQPAFWLPIYETQFSFTPGSWMGNKLLSSRENPAETCVFVGASTTREGFDVNLIEELVPGLRAVNLGTTGGNSAVDTLEIQARILREFGDRYRCIVMGLHPMFLRTFEPDAYEVLSTEYAALLPASALFDMTLPPWKTNPVGQLGLRFLLPAAQYAEQLRRLARYALFEAHSASFGNDLELKNFELFDGELVKPAYFYPPGSILGQLESSYAAKLEESGWANPSLYGHPEEAAALQGTLQILAKLTDRLIVVEMPQSFLLDDAETVSRPSYEAAIRGAGVPLQAFRCAIPRGLQYEFFYDEVHMNSAGREAISQDFAPWLADTAGYSGAMCLERDYTN